MPSQLSTPTRSGAGPKEKVHLQMGSAPAGSRSGLVPGPYPLAMRVRDELGELFADEGFAEAFGVRGRPGWSPGRLALVTVL